MIVTPKDVTITFNSSGPQEHIFVSHVIVTGLKCGAWNDAQTIRQLKNQYNPSTFAPISTHSGERFLCDFLFYLYDCFRKK